MKPALMHVDGSPGERMNLYRKLWNHFTEGQRAGVTTKEFAFHHLAVLVSDNHLVYRYHWSLRQQRLVLQGSGLIEKRRWLRPWEQVDRWYHYEQTDLEHRRGVAWRKFPTDLDVAYLNLFYEFRVNGVDPVDH